jgi:hypothetical protein
VSSTGKETSKGVGVLRVLSCRGDDCVVWDRARVAAGDAEALAAIHEAERICSQERARGATAFRMAPGQAPQRLETFDPHAEHMVMVPRVVGG